MTEPKRNCVFTSGSGSAQRRHTYLDVPGSQTGMRQHAHGLGRKHGQPGERWTAYYYDADNICVAGFAGEGERMFTFDRKGVNHG